MQTMLWTAMSSDLEESHIETPVIIDHHFAPTCKVGRSVLEAVRELLVGVVVAASLFVVVAVSRHQPLLCGAILVRAHRLAPAGLAMLLVLPAFAVRLQENVLISLLPTEPEAVPVTACVQPSADGDELGCAR